MTFPCKEELIEFEKWSNQQVQIYPDACDCGIRLGDILPEKLEQMRVSLNEMIGMFKKPRYAYSADNWEGGRSVSFFVPIEMYGGLERGVSFRIAFLRDAKISGGGFISIDIHSTARHPYVESSV